MSGRPAILVTGGAGYIGSHCCRALDAAGYRPVIYDNFSTGHRSFVTGALVVGDIADKATLGARICRPRHRSRHALRRLEPGGQIRHRSAKILRQQPRRHAVAAGSHARGRLQSAWCFRQDGAVYGNADSKAGAARMTPARRSIHTARSKWMIERGAGGLSAGLRPRIYSRCAISTPAVPILPEGIGELRDVGRQLIPRAMMALQGHVPDFAVFGDDYDTPDGTGDPRLYPRHRPRRSACPGARTPSAGSFRWRLEPRHRQRLLGARDSRGDR